MSQNNNGQQYPEYKIVERIGYIYKNDTNRAFCVFLTIWPGQFGCRWSIPKAITREDWMQIFDDARAKELWPAVRPGSMDYQKQERSESAPPPQRPSAPPPQRASAPPPAYDSGLDPDDLPF